MKTRAVFLLLAMVAVLVAIKAATAADPTPVPQPPPGRPALTNLVGASSAQIAAKPIMHSRVIQWSDMKPQPSDIGTFRAVCDDPTITYERVSCHVTTLEPGKAPHPAHRHPEEEMVFVKEGTLEVVQNNVTNQVSAGGMVFCASGELHGWRNSSANPVTYYVLTVIPHDLKKTD